MDWSSATWWWIAAGVLVALEMITGTFYLLMLAVGALAGAATAHADRPFGMQTMAAALCGGAALALWHWRVRSQPAADAQSMQLDVGEVVHVAAWQTDGSARIDYRGAQWDARYVGSGTAQPGRHQIRAIDGTRLLLER